MMIFAPETVPKKNLSPPSEREDKSWLLTYTDLVSLMLAFFVLLFSMSKLSMQEWDTVAGTISRSEVPTNEKLQKQEKEALTISGKNFEPSLSLDYLNSLLGTQLTKTSEAKDAIIQRFEDQLAISLPSKLLFRPNSADLSQAGRAALADIGSVLRNIDNKINVFGHTDPDVITRGRYASNWELSLARALSVASVLKRAGYPGYIATYGAGPSQFPFVSPRFSLDERKSLSRRVDIIIDTKSRGQTRGQE